MLIVEEEWQDQLTKLRDHRFKAYSRLEAPSIRYGHWYALIGVLLSEIVWTE